MRIFICHTNQDNHFCDALVMALRDAGCDVWFDEFNLGLDLPLDKVEQELRTRPIFIVILSSYALQSVAVKNQCQWAYRLWSRKWAPEILPVVAHSFSEDDLWLFL